MANPTRTEVEITLDGKTRTLRASFHALCEIEKKTGKGIVALARSCWAGDVSLFVVTAVIWAGMRATDKRSPSFDGVGQMIADDGLHRFLEPVLEFLAMGLTGGEAGAGSGAKGGTKTGTASKKKASAAMKTG